jgi:hypothetical protein
MLVASEGCERRVVLEEALKLLQRCLVVTDRVRALSSGLLAVHEAFAGLGQGRLTNHRASSLASDSDNHRACFRQLDRPSSCSREGLTRLVCGSGGGLPDGPTVDLAAARASQPWGLRWARVAQTLDPADVSPRNGILQDPAGCVQLSRTGRLSLRSASTPADRASFRPGIRPPVQPMVGRGSRTGAGTFVSAVRKLSGSISPSHDYHRDRVHLPGLPRGAPL